MSEENGKININKQIDCLDKGFVRLVDYMGDDAAIVQAARVSYGKGTTSKKQDQELIRYLLRHRHTSPFEMVEFKFHVKLPIFIARQWIRHRTANVNEYSGRYSEMKNEFYIPEPDQIRKQSTLNKQGRSDKALPYEEAKTIIDKLDTVQQNLFNEYNGMLEMDLARELSRINLPLSTYTEWYWKIDLHNLLHFLRLRIDHHAQYEIQVFGLAIAELIKPVVPLAFEAFENYNLGSATFSKQELSIIKEMIATDIPSDERMAELGISGLEAVEFKRKMKQMGE